MGLINKKVGDFSLKKALMVAGGKMLVEQLVSPVLGNGTLVSGGAKLVASWGIPKIVGGGDFIDALATGAAVDGAEDIFQSLLGGGLSVGQRQSAPNVI